MAVDIGTDMDMDTQPWLLWFGRKKMIVMGVLVMNALLGYLGVVFSFSQYPHKLVPILVMSS